MRSITRAVVVILMLAQWAVVSHACAWGSASGAIASMPAAGSWQLPMATVATPPPAASLADCDSMDSMTAYAQDKPCADHCNMGKQGDLSASVTVPAVLLSLFYVRPPTEALTFTMLGSRSERTSMAVSDPPHAILHCVRRT